MSNMLMSALIHKKAISDDTIITASYRSKDLFGRSFIKTGEFKIKKIVGDTPPIFELGSIDVISEIIRTDAAAIKAIDGMDLIRYADIYDILPNGMSKKVGRKRGRKPKTQLTT